MSNYEEFHRLSGQFIGRVKAWADDHSARDNAYHTAIVIWRQVERRAHKNSDFCSKCVEWLNCSGTVLLADLLSKTRYNPSSLVHFNAFSLLDTCSKEDQPK